MPLRMTGGLSVQARIPAGQWGAIRELPALHRHRPALGRHPPRRAPLAIGGAAMPVGPLSCGTINSNAPGPTVQFEAYLFRHTVYTLSDSSHTHRVATITGTWA